MDYAYQTTKEMTTETDWEKEFYALCAKLHLREETISGLDEISPIKDFIKSLLSSYKEELRGKIGGLELLNEDENAKRGYRLVVNHILSLLQDTKEPEE